MEQANSFVNQLLFDPPIKFNTRYKIVPQLPMNLGGLNLAYNNNSFQVIYTKSVGQEGLIIWNLNTFIQTVRNAVTKVCYIHLHSSDSCLQSHDHDTF